MSAVEARFGLLGCRPETEADIGFLRALHDSVKGAAFALLPADAYRQLLDMQFRAMTQSYRSGFPAGRFEVITLDQVPIGRLITDEGAHRFAIVYVALLPAWRGRGLGTALMRSVLAAPQRAGMACEAIVAVDNAVSLRLWARLGFTEGERSATDVTLRWVPR